MATTSYSRVILLHNYITSRTWAEQPSHALFGHVHQPLHRRARIGRTECVNAGHFRAHGTPYVLRF